MKKEKYFYQYPLSIDNVHINEQGMLQGGSIHPLITFECSEKNEKTALSDIVSVLRNVNNKLFFIDGLSNIKRIASIKNPLSGSAQTVVTLTNDFFTIKLQEKDIEVIEGVNGSYIHSMGSYLKSVLGKEIPYLRNIKIQPMQVPFSVSQDVEPFRAVYISCGNNNNHAGGSLSFFEVLERHEGYSEACDTCMTGNELVSKAVKDIDMCIVFNESSIVEQTETHFTLDYLGGSITITNTYPMIMLESEANIQNLADWFERYNKTQLGFAKIKQYRLSNGLKSGALRETEELTGEVFSLV